MSECQVRWSPLTLAFSWLHCATACRVSSACSSNLLVSRRCSSCRSLSVPFALSDSRLCVRARAGVGGSGAIRVLELAAGCPDCVSVLRRRDTTNQCHEHMPKPDAKRFISSFIACLSATIHTSVKDPNVLPPPPNPLHLGRLHLAQLPLPPSSYLILELRAQARRLTLLLSQLRQVTADLLLVVPHQLLEAPRVGVMLLGLCGRQSTASGSGRERDVKSVIGNLIFGRFVTAHSPPNDMSTSNGGNRYDKTSCGPGW